MSFLTIVRMVQSSMLNQRCVACTAQELQTNDDPVTWVAQNIWLICASPGWSEAWASADAGAGTQGDWGADEAVITDGMILSAVQPLVPPMP